MSGSSFIYPEDEKVSPKKVSLHQILKELDGGDVDDSSSHSVEVFPTAKLRLDQLSLMDENGKNQDVEVVTRKHAKLNWSQKKQQAQRQSKTHFYAPHNSFLDHQEEDFEIISQKPVLQWMDDPAASYADSCLWTQLGESREFYLWSVCGAFVFIAAILSAIYRRRKGKPIHSNVDSSKRQILDANEVFSSLMNGDVSVDVSQLSVAHSEDTSSENDNPQQDLANRDTKQIELTPSHPPSLCKEKADPSHEAADNACTTSNPSSSSTSPTSSGKVKDSCGQYTMHDPPSQLAQDLQVVQEVFEQMSLDVSLVPQVAISLRSSQNVLVAVQGAKEEQLRLQDHHLRSLQQQFSNQNNGGLFYDANWKDKLRQKRDVCWSIACRLLLEVTLAHLAVQVFQPVLNILLSARSSPSSDRSTLLTSTKLLDLVLQSLCDCSSVSENVLQASSTPEDTPTIWLSFVPSTNEVFSQYWGWDKYSSMNEMLERGTCYGYCLASTAILLTLTMIGHQVLRAFSAPTMLHQVVNLMALSTMFGGVGSASWADLIQYAPFALPLLLGVLGLLAVIQFHYRAQRQHMIQSNNFRKSWEECVDAMEDLRLRILLTRYSSLIIIAGMLWYSSSQGGQHGILS